MSQVDRFGVSMDTELLAAFDRYIAARGYENRSEAIRDMIRDALVSDLVRDEAAEVVAVLSLVCRHEPADTGPRLRECLAGAKDLVIGSLHLPGDSEHEVQAVAMRGQAAAVRQLADRVGALRGITNTHLHLIPQEHHPR